MFWSCPEVRLFWKYIEEYIRRCSYQHFILKIQHSVYGIQVTEKEEIDLILNYALFSIYKCIKIGIASTKKIRCIDFKMMFIYVIKSRYDDEKHKRKENVYMKLTKWNSMLNNLWKICLYGLYLKEYCFMCNS